jgi:CRISPR-associated protein Csx10
MTGEGTFTISLSMLSDWHVGTGTGIHGYVDRMVQRDVEDDSSGPAAPIVPAKTLIGVWRDSCEVAAQALDSGSAGVWHEWLGFLFGDQYATGGSVLRPAALTIEGPLRLPERLTRLMRDKPRLAWAATFRKPGVAIDPVSGTASNNKLWFDEMARAGLTLEGRGHIEGFTELDERQRRAAVLLLTAGARLLEGIGGKRRRGAGRCSMSLEGPGLVPDWSSEAIRDVPGPPSASLRTVPVRVSRPVPKRRGWERAELVIAVEQPILAATTVLGNVTIGEGHVPGWCLMPEVVRRLGREAHALVRTGDLVVTAATPQATDGSRTLPAPRSLACTKDGKEIIGNRMAGPVELGKPCRDGYVVPATAEIVKTHTTVRMHNSIDDRTQRPTREIGGIYVYRALAARTTLRAEVRVQAGLLRPNWEQRLSGRWRIGRSSKDDYGQARVTVRPIADDHDGVEAGDLLRVWLLSDLLVRDVRLRPSTNLQDVARALEQALSRADAPNVRLEPVVEPHQDGSVTVAVGVHRTESWHRGWHMPRATLYGLAAGSCLTFKVTGGSISSDALAEIHAAGVGDRRSEGFGQVELNHDLLTRPISAVQANNEWMQPTTGRKPLLAPGERGHQEARIFERAAWRTEIRRSCDGIRGDRERRAEIIPRGVTNTQLNALRAVVREPSRERAIARFQWLTQEKAGRADWPPDAISTLHDLLTDRDKVWRLLKLPQESLVITTDGVESLRAELRTEALRILVDSCLAAHSRAEVTGDLEGNVR